jgi:hypothetical protein
MMLDKYEMDCVRSKGASFKARVSTPDGDCCRLEHPHYCINDMFIEIKCQGKTVQLSMQPCSKDKLNNRDRRYLYVVRPKPLANVSQQSSTTSFRRRHLAVIQPWKNKQCYDAYSVQTQR